MSGGQVLGLALHLQLLHHVRWSWPPGNLLLPGTRALLEHCYRLCILHRQCVGALSSQLNSAQASPFLGSAGYVRYWLSAGRGGFGLSPKECMAPAFYCMVYTKDGAFPDPTQGISVKTSPVPINPIFYTNIKSVNYLPNVLCQMDAEDAGYDQVCCWHDLYMKGLHLSALCCQAL